MVPTLFSVSYAGLWGQHQLDLETFIRKAAALGYSAVELMGKRQDMSGAGGRFAELSEEIDKAKEDINKLLTWYYSARGWNENGIPTRETLISAGLPEVVEEFENRGLLAADG